MNEIPRSELCYYDDRAISADVVAKAQELLDAARYVEAVDVLLPEVYRQRSNRPSNLVGASVAEATLMLAEALYRSCQFDQLRELRSTIANTYPESQYDYESISWYLWGEISEGNYEEVAEESLSVIEMLRDDWQSIISEFYYLASFCKKCLGFINTAIELGNLAHALFTIYCYDESNAQLCSHIGLMYLQCSKYDRSIEWFIKSEDLNRRANRHDLAYAAKLNHGIAHYKSGQYSRARALLSEVVDMVSVAGTKCRTHIALANVHRLTRNFPDARKHLTQAYSMATDLKIPREECLSLEFLGDVYRDEGKPEEARRYYQRGMAIARAIAPEGDLVMELLRREGECLVLEGKPGEGLEILARARTHARKLGDRFEEGVTLRCLAEGMLRTADHVQALRYAEEAASQLESIDARHEHAIARLVAADILLDYSREPEADAPRDLLDQAWEHTLVAQPICRALEIEYWDDRVKRLQSRIARRRAEEARYAIPKAPPAPGDEYKPGDIIIAESRAMHEVMQAVEAFSPCDEPLLLTGETGTGKEVIAKRIHQLSLRKDKPFVAVNVTAIPHTMFEREFFGHTRGAFSGADHDRSGLAAEADGGTLFLDEIGDLAPATQAKLLRLLQDGSYLCLGDPVERRADLRVIAATNLELESAVADGRFREDLYYRLAILAIPLPPLRSRPEDIRPLLDHFLSLSAGRRVSADGYFNELSLKLLEKYGWPGNAREVALVARRAHITKQTYGRVEIEVGSGENAMVLTGHDRAAAAQAGSATSADSQPLNRARILLALEEAGGNRSKAARSLGVSRATFYRRLEKYDLDVD